jgi:hypothetical protein
MAAPYSATPVRSAWQANKMMSQSVPLDCMSMDPNVMRAAAQLAQAQGGMNAPGGGYPGMMPPGMMPPGGGMMPPGMMPPGGGMMPPGMMPPGGGMMPPGMMPPGGGMMPPPGMFPQGGPGGPGGNFPPMNSIGMPPMAPPGSIGYGPGASMPGMRPPGAVAALGAITGPGNMPGAPGATIGRTQVRFAGPSGMHVAWLTQGPDGKPAYSAPVVETPGRYNFLQASIYRLKLNGIAGRPGLEVYPTLEVVPGNPKTEAFLAHSAVPLEFTAEDFQEVAEGKYLVKVIYLPDPQFQELAATGTDQIISTRLEPGADPLLEAQRRGSILLVIRMGNVDQEAPNTPPLESNNAGPGAMMMMPPGMMPPVAGGPLGPMQGAGPGGAPEVPSYLRFGASPAQPSGPASRPAAPPAPSISPAPTGPVSHLPDPSEVRTTAASESVADDVVPSPRGSMPTLPPMPPLAAGSK